MHIALRPADAEDEAFLLRLYESTRADELASLSEIQQEAFMRLQFVAQRAAYRAQFPHADHRIILVDGQPVGRLLVNRTGEEIRLVDISLLADHRNRGIGTWLLEQLQAETAATPGPLTLHVVVTNPAINLYRRLGFVATSDTGSHLLMEWRARPVTARSETNR
jgi:ribosomal protein S18 acetylase RimI-like enzyme